MRYLSRRKIGRLLFEFADSKSKDLYRYIHKRCVDMSVSVCSDPSFREEIGFIILHHKYNEII